MGRDSFVCCVYGMRLFAGQWILWYAYAYRRERARVGRVLFRSERHVKAPEYARMIAMIYVYASTPATANVQDLLFVPDRSGHLALSLLGSEMRREFGSKQAGSTRGIPRVTRRSSLRHEPALPLSSWPRELLFLGSDYFIILATGAQSDPI